MKPIKKQHKQSGALQDPVASDFRHQARAHAVRRDARPELRRVWLLAKLTNTRTRAFQNLLFSPWYSGWGKVQMRTYLKIESIKQNDGWIFFHYQSMHFQNLIFLCSYVLDLAKFSTKIHHSQVNDTFSADSTGMTSGMMAKQKLVIFGAKNWKFKKNFRIFFFALFNSKCNSEKKKISCIFWLKTSFTFI